MDGLRRINRELIAKAEATDSPQRVVLDMDPRLRFNREGHCLGAKLRSGNMHSAEDWPKCFCPRLMVNRDWQSAVESVHELAGVRRRCCRSGPQMDNFGLCGSG